MFRLIPIGTGQQQPVVGAKRTGVPHLLTVDDPFVTVTLGAGGEPGQIRPVARLAEQLAPLVLTGQHRAQQAGLQLVAAAFEQGGRGQGHGGPGGRPDRAELFEHLAHNGGGGEGQPAAEPLLGPGRTTPTGIRQHGAPLAQKTVLVPMLRKPGPHLVADSGSVEELTHRYLQVRTT